MQDMQLCLNAEKILADRNGSKDTSSASKSMEGQTNSGENEYGMARPGAG